MASRRKRRGQSPGLVNLGIAGGIVAILVPLILQASQASPPAVAEFAPNAKQAIKKAPADQAAAEAPGAPAGASPSSRPSATARPSPSPSPTAPTLSIARNQLKACVGSPPRQTEDPQSPPCVPYWTGDNGGVTATGVTKDTISIVIPTPEGREKEYQALANHFNKRYEFYGRKLVFAFCKPVSGSNLGSSDKRQQDADAAAAAAGCGGPKPFASSFYRSDNGRYFLEGMACTYKTIAVGSYSPYDSTYMNKCAPRLYQYLMDSDNEFAHMGDWACRRLVGRNASHAAGNDSSTPPQAITSRKRSFGIFLAPYYADDPVANKKALRPLTDRLRQCGAPVPDANIIVNPVANAGAEGVPADPGSANNAMLKMKQNNVTSVFCLCNLFSFGALQKASTSQNFHPEWLASTFGLIDINTSFVLGASPSDQLANTFGLTFQPRQVLPALEPYNQAVQEGDPSIAPVTTTNDVQNRQEIYRPLLMLAAGIQLAGPRLTVESFRDGLRKANFPNPVTESRAGAVDVPSDGWSMTSDAAEWWWSNTATGPFADSSSRPGTICYVDGGNRRKVGGWPTGRPDPFFTGTCDSGASG
ncbi:MAG: hypothetical protein JJD92_07090 [Frankiaceae bacterium]|nr:hypothetical protein [Frankiaceae bacterium]